MQLRDINERLQSVWGLDVVIDAEGARSLKFVSDRGRFLEAIEAGPRAPEADRYVRRSLRAAGYTVADHGADPDDGDNGAFDRPQATSSGPAAPTAGAGAAVNGDANAEHRDTPSEPGRWPSIHVYGRKAALTIEADSNRRGRATIAIDAAGARGDGQFDWGNKIRVQLTPNELVDFTAVLLGAIDRCLFENRGDNAEKGLSLDRQDEGHEARFFLRVFARGARPCAVPVSAADALWVLGLCMRQLRSSHPWMDQPDMEALVRAAYRRPATSSG